MSSLKNIVTRSSKEYKALKSLVGDLDNRKLLTQMQFCLPSKTPPCSAKGEYFITDQVWVKYDEFDDIVDMVIVDVKLSKFTNLTRAQELAKNQVGKGSLAYKASSTKEFDEFDIRLPKEINQGDKIPITSFYKLYGDGLGNFVGVIN